MSEQPGVGQRIAEARRHASLTQTELGERIGLSLWAVERLEHGGGDASRHIGSIARATGVDEAWLAVDGAQQQAPFSPAADVRARAPDQPAWATVSFRRSLVLGSLALLVFVRFFTEVVPVLPRAANFVDVPLLAALGAFACVVRPERGSGRLGDRPYFAPAIGFLAIAVLSTLLNLQRIEPAPVLVFLYGFLAPLAFYYAAWRLWPVGEAAALSRLLVFLGLLQLVVVALIDLPRFAGNANPDEISGTFGENAYQLVFFLVVFCALLGGIETFEPKRPVFTATHSGSPLERSR